MATADPILGFEAWKQEDVAKHAKKRKYSDSQVYKSDMEPLPDLHWYGLDVAAIDRKIGHMCSNLKERIETESPADQEMADLFKELNEGKQVRRSKSTLVAVVGEQGIGKSSILNALLHRPELNDVSASGHACTSLATIIEWKEGADASTTHSDIHIEFLATTELEESFAEHIRRYSYYKFQMEQDKKDADEENGPSSENDETCTRISKEERQGAQTALECFNVLWNTEHNEDAAKELQSLLNDLNKNNDSFLQACIFKGRARAWDAGVRNEILSFGDVPDSELGSKRDIASALSPLVRLVRILTGSLLLMNGISFVDLPGKESLYHNSMTF